MRPSWHRDLAALILLLAVCRSPAFAERVRPKPVQKPATVVKTFEESAYGGDKEMARSLAAAKLLVDVNGWLLAEHPEITYSPIQSDVEGLIRHVSEPRPVTLKKGAGVDLPEQVEVTLTAELTTSDLARYETHSRNQLSQYRQGLLARGLAGAVALLAVGTGYLKLEEKVGRHKKKLGMAAIGLLGLVGLTWLVW